MEDALELKRSYDIEMAMQAQDDYIKTHHLPHFPPYDGICYSCRCQIYAHISVEEAGHDLISGCPCCGASYVD